MGDTAFNTARQVSPASHGALAPWHDAAWLVFLVVEFALFVLVMFFILLVLLIVFMPFCRCNRVALIMFVMFSLISLSRPVQHFCPFHRPLCWSSSHFFNHCHRVVVVILVFSVPFADSAVLAHFVVFILLSPLSSISLVP